MDEAQNFWIQTNKPHGIVEDRISFQKQKQTNKQHSSFKITTCETFSKKNEQWHFTGAMSSQATAWHHITRHTPESLLVKLKY